MFFRELVVKHLQVLLYHCVFSLQSFLDSFDFRLVLSQSFQNLLCLNATSLDTKWILDWVLFEEIKDFHPFEVKFLVNQEV